jgi:glycine/D-amino acid oxidase-like deaminating enzyme
MKCEPYWWEGVSWPELPTAMPAEESDVAIVGSGYTGLAAATELARAGRRVRVFESECLGWGCSTRNGGQVSSHMKTSLSALRAQHGEERAVRIRREGQHALKWLEDFIAREKIECDYVKVGRFYAAHNAAAYRALARDLSEQPKWLMADAYLVPRARQHEEIGSDFYHGGAVLPQCAALHPAKLHRALLERALQAGTSIIEHCAVVDIQRENGRFRLLTSRGPTRAREVIVATNGYTGHLTPWLRRRVMPIGSYIIATEPLPPEVTRRLIPHNRVISDTRRLIFYYRLSEDGRRLLFGGRVAVRERDPSVTAPRLHHELTRIFPELSLTRITHSWVGFVAYTFDRLPHLGRQADGIHYCMGYCGTGIALASYLGTRVAQQLMGRPEGRTALDGLAFPGRFFYGGDPWLLSVALGYYKLRDRVGA